MADTDAFSSWSVLRTRWACMISSHCPLWAKTRSKTGADVAENSTEELNNSRNRSELISQPRTPLLAQLDFSRTESQGQGQGIKRPTIKDNHNDKDLYTGPYNPHPNKLNYNLIRIRGVWTYDGSPGNLTTIHRFWRFLRLYPCCRGRAVQWCCRRCHRKLRYTGNRYGALPNRK